MCHTREMPPVEFVPKSTRSKIKNSTALKEQTNMFLKRLAREARGSRVIFSKLLIHFPRINILLSTVAKVVEDGM